MVSTCVLQGTSEILQEVSPNPGQPVPTHMSSFFLILLIILHLPYSPNETEKKTNKPQNHKTYINSKKHHLPKPSSKLKTSS